MLVPPSVDELIRLALEEDLGRGDLTALAVPEKKTAKAQIIAREACVVSGLWLATEIVRAAKADLHVEICTSDGAALAPNQPLLQLEGNARALLSLERTILNFLQRTCGIATQAARYRQALGNDLAQVRLVDTRKTIPGWRYLDKMAVRHGGLFNHRFGLDSGILVKENHIRAAGGIRAAVQALQKQVPHLLQIEVEVTTVDEAWQAIEAGAHSILLDNFSAKDLGIAVAAIRQKFPKMFLEASGGITLENLHSYAASGVDCLSIGALTHSVPAANLSLLFDVK